MVRRGAGRARRWLAAIAAGAAFVPIALWWLRLLGLVPDGHPLAAIEYVPPSLLLPPLAVAVAALVVARTPVPAALLVLGWFAIALFRGDHALAARRAPPPDGAGFELSALAWRLEGNPSAVSVAADLGRLRPDVAILAGAVEGSLPEAVWPRHVATAPEAGLAVVGAHRVLASRAVDVPGHDRPLLHAELEVAGARVHVLAVDLGEAGATLDEAFLRRQAEAGPFLAAYLAALEGPAILGGDLAAPPSTALVRRLAALADDVHLAGRFLGEPLLPFGTVLGRREYLLVRGLAPVRSERLPPPVAGGRPLLGVALLAPAGLTARAEPGVRLPPGTSPR